MSADLLDFTAVEVPPVWQVLGVGACLLTSGAAGVGLAAWTLQMLADGLSSHNALGGRLAEALAAELRTRCQQRLRAVSATLAAVVLLALVALVTGVAA